MYDPNLESDQGADYPVWILWIYKGEGRSSVLVYPTEAEARAGFDHRLALHLNESLLLYKAKVLRTHLDESEAPF